MTSSGSATTRASGSLRRTSPARTCSSITPGSPQGATARSRRAHASATSPRLARRARRPSTSRSSEPMPPRSQSERAAERRRQKLEQVQEQIRNGSLTVRQVTPEERAGWARASARRSPRR
jgi:anti-sigma28 factor (negative regulator of flagellin synthesis)